MRIGGWSWALVVEVRGWWADWCCFWPSDCIPESQGQEEEGPKPCVARAAIIATDRCWTSSWKREVVCQEPRIGKRVRVGQIRFPLQRLGESEKKLEDIVHDANRFVDSIRRFASQGLQISEKRLSVLAGRSQPAQGAKEQALGCCERSDEESWRLTGRAASSSTNSVELKKRIPSSTLDRVGGLIEAAYDCMQADNQDSGELTEQDGDAWHLSFAGACARGHFLDWKVVLERQRWLKLICVSISSNYLNKSAGAE